MNRVYDEGGELKASPSKGNSNFELRVNGENYFLAIIKHIAVLSSKLEFPFVNLSLKLFNWQSSSHL